MQKHQRALPFVAALATLILVPGASRAQYSFTRIAQSHDTFGIDGPAAINDAGQVTFGAVSSTGPGIFVGSGGPLTTIADTTGRFSFFGFSSIDGQGNVTFFANTRDGHSGFFTGPGGTTFLDDSGPAGGFGGDSHSSTSGAFTTVHAFLKNGGQGIFASNGGPLTTIADTTGRFSGFDTDPRVNATGQVAFQGMLRAGGSGIFVGSGGALTPIADTSGVFSDFTGSPSINDRGEVAFGGLLKSGKDGIFVGSGGQVRTYVDSSGPFSDFLAFGNPTINNKGQVAFAGDLDTGQTGLFVGPDPVADRVLLVGDPLDGSTVTGFSVFGGDFNNAGQLAFTAFLADGRTEIIRADPVPEPGELALLAALAFLGAGYRRKRRQGLRA